MDINILREIVTVASFGSFLAIVAYAVSPANKKGFDEAARIPLDDEEGPSPQPSPRGEGANVGQVFANREHQ